MHRWGQLALHLGGREEDSWKFFDRLLDKAEVVCTPGEGFGRAAAGHIRISAFNNYEKVQTAMERLKTLMAA